MQSHSPPTSGLCVLPTVYTAFLRPSTGKQEFRECQGSTWGGLGSMGPWTIYTSAICDNTISWVPPGWYRGARLQHGPTVERDNRWWQKDLKSTSLALALSSGHWWNSIDQDEWGNWGWRNNVSHRVVGVGSLLAQCTEWPHLADALSHGQLLTVPCYIIVFIGYL
jgi:hypothetical protein